MFRGGLLPAQLKRNMNLVVLDCKSCAAAFISAATAGSVLLIRNPLRPLCVLSVSAVSLFEYLFTAEAQSSRRLRREKSQSGRYLRLGDNSGRQ